MSRLAFVALSRKKGPAAEPFDNRTQAVARPVNDKEREVLCPTHQKFFLFNFFIPHPPFRYLIHRRRYNLHIALALSFEPVDYVDGYAHEEEEAEGNDEDLAAMQVREVA